MRRGLVVLILLALIPHAFAACGGEPRSENSAAGATHAEESRETAPATTATETATIDPAARALAALVEAWYARADPAVCERMTNRLLRFGWEKSGKAGVKACKRNLEDAEPADDVVIVEAAIQGEKAEVTVSYAGEGGAARDRVHFLRRDGEWRMDEVAVVVEQTA